VSGIEREPVSVETRRFGWQRGIGFDLRHGRAHGRRRYGGFALLSVAALLLVLLGFDTAEALSVDRWARARP
jgi:hypothetical protein